MGCASITALQTAKTLPKHKFAHTVAGGPSNSKLKLDSATDGTSFWGVDYLGRFGLTDQDEVSVRVANWATYLEAGYKRSLIGDGPVLLSVGAGLGYTGFTSYSSSSSSGDIRVDIVDFSIPLYVDFVLGEMSTIYLVPRYSFRISQNQESTDSFSQVGGSGGFKYGKKIGGILELGYLKPMKKNTDGFYQIMGGMFF